MARDPCAQLEGRGGEGRRDKPTAPDANEWRRHRRLSAAERNCRIYRPQATNTVRKLGVFASALQKTQTGGEKLRTISFPSCYAGFAQAQKKPRPYRKGKTKSAGCSCSGQSRGCINCTTCFALERLFRKTLKLTMVGFLNGASPTMCFRTAQSRQRHGKPGKCAPRGFKDTIHSTNIFPEFFWGEGKEHIPNTCQTPKSYS